MWRSGKLIDSVAAYIGVEPTDEQAFFTAELIWQQFHGIVSLRISWPMFSVASTAETVTEAIDLLNDSYAERAGFSVYTPLQTASARAPWSGAHLRQLTSRPAMFLNRGGSAMSNSTWGG